MSLQNFEKAREAMVLSQLQPSGVINPDLGDAYNAIPREMFVPNSVRGVCYCDDAVDLGGGRELIEPLYHGLMLQAAQITKGMKVLDVAGATGYSAAILSKVGAVVTAVDNDEKMLHAAQQNWTNLGLKAISPFVGANAQGYAKSGPYDVIIVNGAVGFRPDALLAQLKAGGKLLCIYVNKDEPIGSLMSYQKLENGEFAAKKLHDATSKFVPGLEPKLGFEF